MPNYLFADIVRDSFLFGFDHLSSYNETEKKLIISNKSLDIEVHSTFSYPPTYYQHFKSLFHKDKSSLPSNTKLVMKLLTEDMYNSIFSRRNKLYSYENFITSISMWPMFCGEFINTNNKIKTCINEIVSLLTHITQEVGTYDKINSQIIGLDHLEEIGCQNNSCPQYNSSCSVDTWVGTAYTCNPKKTYHGRGPIQLSYNYNYGHFSQKFLGDSNLLENPDLLVQNELFLFNSALYFYMTSQYPKPSIHHIVTGIWQPSTYDIENGRNIGFGVQNLIINGAVECNKGIDTDKSINRLEIYRVIAEFFGIWHGQLSELNNSCKSSKPFNSKSNVVSTYIGLLNKFECGIINWQESSFSILNPGDLASCHNSIKSGIYPKRATHKN